MLSEEIESLNNRLEAAQREVSVLKLARNDKFTEERVWKGFMLGQSANIRAREADKDKQGE